MPTCLRVLWNVNVWLWGTNNHALSICFEMKILKCYISQSVIIICVFKILNEHDDIVSKWKWLWLWLFQVLDEIEHDVNDFPWIWMWFDDFRMIHANEHEKKI